MRTACGLAPLGTADCWCESYGPGRREVVASDACFPVDVSDGAGTDDWKHWRVADATVWLQAWLEHVRAHLAAAAMLAAPPAQDAAAAPNSSVTLGMEGAQAIGSWADVTTPARIDMTPENEAAGQGSIEFTSDGSVEEPACEAWT